MNPHQSSPSSGDNAGIPTDRAHEEARAGPVGVGEPTDFHRSAMQQGEPMSDERKRAEDVERAKMERAARYLKGPTAFSA